MRDSVIVVGAGAHARRVAEGIAGAGGQVVAFAVTHASDNGDGSPERPLSLTVALERFRGRGAIVAIGDGEARRLVSTSLSAAGVELITMVHPRAVVSPSATLGEGAVILAAAVVDAGVQVGTGAIVDIGALIAHDAIIGAWTHLRPGCVVPPRGVVPAGAVVPCGGIVTSGSDD